MAEFKRSRAHGLILHVTADYGASLGWINEVGQFLHDCTERAPLESRDHRQIARWCDIVKNRAEHTNNDLIADLKRER